MFNLKKILLTILMASVFCTLFIRAMEDLPVIDNKEGIYVIVFYFIMIS